MELILTSDWHITTKKPENRIDDYYQTLKRKIRFIFETAEERGINTILQAGDMTDSPFMSWTTLIDLYNDIFNKYKEIDIISLYGQHDLRYRNKGNTAIDAMNRFYRNIHLIGGGGSRLSGWPKSDKVFVYGSSYGEDTPEVISTGFNILLIHRMIIQDKLWEGQEEYTSAGSFLRSNKFDLVVSGDNHQGFVVDSKIQKKYLVNCGSLLRSTTKQLDHEPFFVIFDTDTNNYEKVMIPIEPVDKVFNLEKVIKEKAKDENLEAYVSGLLESKEIGLKLEDNLNAFMDKNSTEQSVRDILEWAKIGGER